MSGFQSLGSLRHLYLGNNKIQHIKGLETCHSLTKLWLDSNEIQSIKGLSGLKSLQDLNLACNLISTIGTGLDSLAYLKELNLSANRIGSFKEVLNLSRLPKLESVSFSDANYGENPICLLCNYSTYVLFHLPTLSKLDTKYVTDDERQHSESTFMKKRMYYNMRIKLIQKNTNNVIQVLKVCRAIRHTKIAMRIDKL
jgi:Leucine-rich repeat (LRR) protein